MKFYSILLSLSIALLIPLSSVYATTITFHPPASLNGSFIWNQVVTCYDNNGNIVPSKDELKYFCYSIQGDSINKLGEKVHLDGKPIKYTSTFWYAVPLINLTVVDANGKTFKGDIVGSITIWLYKNCKWGANYALTCDKK